MSAFGNRMRKINRSLEPFKRSGNDSNPPADFLRQLEGNEFIAAFLTGRSIVVEFDGAQSVVVRHGLGRVPIGCEQQWVNDNSRRVSMFEPAGTAVLGDLDTTEFVEIGTDSNWVAGKARVYIY